MSIDESFLKITIPSTEVKDGVVFYIINVKLPYKNYNVPRRFNEFQALKQNLEILRMSNTLPYQLPSKITLFASNEKVVEKRRQELSKFLNDMIHDKNLRSNQLVLEFLNLPKSIFMTEDITIKEDWLTKKSDAIDVNSWVPQLKNASNAIKNVTTKIFNDAIDNSAARTQIINLKKEIDTLSKSLTNEENSLGDGELRRRNDLLSLLKKEYYELDVLVKERSSRAKPTMQMEDRQQLFNTNKRVLGKPKETSATLPLNNEELYQQQQVQLQRQDSDIDHIRSIIQRQKEIALVINNEVNEQNELLNDLSQQVDESSDKMRTAKKMIRKIR